MLVYLFSKSSLKGMTFETNTLTKVKKAERSGFLGNSLVKSVKEKERTTSMKSALNPKGLLR